MLEQQAKEMPRRDVAASEPVDETLSVVRQLMAAESSPPAKSAAPPEPVAESEPSAPLAPERREKPVRGRAALPDLAMPEQMESQAQHQEAPAKAPRAALWRRLGALALRRRARADVAAEPEVAEPEEDSLSAPDEIWESQVQATPKAEIDLHLIEQTVPEQTVAEQPAPVQSVPGQRTLVQAIKEFRPTRKQIALVALIGIVLWRPWLIPGLLFVAFWVALIVYLTLGPDRVAEIAYGRWQWFSARYPERAGRLLTRAQRGADRLDGWLARLPERWTDGIYLPDLGRSQSEAGPVEDQPDPFDRLAEQQQVMSRRSAGVPEGARVRKRA